MIYDEQKEDLIRWAREFWDNRILLLLWYPDYKPFTKTAQYAFRHDL